MRKIALFLIVTSTLAIVHAQESDPIEIIITGGLVPVTRDHAGTSVTVITSEEIEQRDYDFVSDILKDVPGTSLTSSGGPGTLSELRIRGAEADQTLVLIDGIEANDPAASSGFDFANLLAGDIERIEVLRGAQSALWGSDAIGGVVNIITRSGAGLEQPEYSYAAEYGSFSTLNGAASARGDTGLLDYALSLQYYSTDGISAADENTVTYDLPDGNTLVTGGASEDDGYDNATAHLKFGVDATQDLRLQGVFRNTSFNNEFDGFTTIPVDSTEDRADGDQQYYLLQGLYTQIENTLYHTLKYFGNRSDTDFFSAFGKTDSKGSRDHFGYQIDYNRVINGIDHEITFVVETEEDRLDSTFSGNRKLSSDSLVGEYRFRNNGVAATANLRYDNNHQFEDDTTWRLAGSWQFRPQLRLHTSYGTGIKNPTLVELFGFTPTFIGNPDLEPEKSQGGDLGVEYISADGRYRTDLTGFYREITDLLTGSGNTAVNIDGDSISSGIEFSYAMQVSDVFDVYSTYTYNHTEDETGRQLIRRPRNHFSLGGTYAFFEQKLMLGAVLRYVAGRTDNAFNPDFTSVEVEMDDYTVVDANARYRISDSLAIHARIDNLFNETYQEVLGYGTPGRALYVGLKGIF